MGRKDKGRGVEGRLSPCVVVLVVGRSLTSDRKTCLGDLLDGAWRWSRGSMAVLDDDCELDPDPAARSDSELDSDIVLDGEFSPGRRPPCLAVAAAARETWLLTLGRTGAISDRVVDICVGVGVVGDTTDVRDLEVPTAVAGSRGLAVVWGWKRPRVGLLTS